MREFHLSHDVVLGDWKLHADGAARAVRRFPTKGAATIRGVLERALGPEGGSVRIHNMDGSVDEERTYPGSADPSPPTG